MSETPEGEKKAAMPLCPLMTRPVVVFAGHSGLASSKASLFQVPCLKEKCAWWYECTEQCLIWLIR